VKVLKAAVYQKQAIAYSLEEAATVWDVGGQSASYSGKEYSRLFKEILEALTWLLRNANSSEARSKNWFLVQEKLYQPQ
jgi:hypothetical protein